MQSFTLDAYAARSCPLKTAYRFTPGLEPPLGVLPDPPFFHDADAIEADVYARLLSCDTEAVDLRGLRAADPTAAQAEFDRYRKCERIYARCYYNGTPIRRLTVAA